MHPVEAASILSQLAYIPPSTAATFADAYVGTYGHASMPVFAPVKPYTPQFSDFTYASTYRFEPDTATQYSLYSGAQLVHNYYPDRVGRQSAYQRTLFFMTRDAAVLEVLAKAKPSKTFYCVRNEDPIESRLGLARFKEDYNVNVVYPCTGPYHDDHVPKCVCPVPPPPSDLLAIRAAIRAHRTAAPFATRLADLHQKAGDAHSIAHNFEFSQFPSGSLLANYTFETWEDLGVDPQDWPKGSLDEFKIFRSDEDLEMYEGSAHAAAAARNARHVADAARVDLELYMKETEDAAFAAFKPHVRTILARARTNAVDGYAVQHYPLSVDDISELHATESHPRPGSGANSFVDAPEDGGPPGPIIGERSDNDDGGIWADVND